MSNLDDATRELTRALMERDRYHGRSPLEGYIDAEVKAMGQRLAREIVQENQQLGDAIRARVNAAVTQALTQDEYLNEVVVKAVALSLSQLAIERHDREEG